MKINKIKQKKNFFEKESNATKKNKVKEWNPIFSSNYKVKSNAERDNDEDIDDIESFPWKKIKLEQ